MTHHITLDAEGRIFDMVALGAHLEKLTDRRQARGKRYSLSFLLSVIVLAKLSGQNRPSAIADWLKLRSDVLVSAFQCTRATVPSLNTIRRTLSDTMNVEELATSLNRFLHQTYGGQQSIQVTIDGKTLRGTIPKGSTQGVHLLAAYLPAEGVVLMQVAVETKENELVAAPRLLASLDLRGRVVSGDALFTQHNLSVDILAQGGDYIWYAKDNQRHLKDDIALFFVAPRQAAGWYRPPLPQTQARSTNCAHGRLEQRTLTAIVDENGFIDWPGVRQVFKLERKVTSQATGVTWVETTHGLTSLPPERASATELLEWTRHHWGIENGLHYRRDVTLQEDATRMTSRSQAQAMATLNNFVIALSAKLGFTNLAAAQRTFEAKLTLALAFG